MNKILSHVDVNFCVDDVSQGCLIFTISASLNEALTMFTMPSLSPFIVSVVPNFELSEMPKE